jgi:hypothetical protein
MPLSSEQRRIIDIHIRSKTSYNGTGTDNIYDRLHIVNSLEQVLDSDRGCRLDLFLPDSFITIGSSHDFWCWVAVLMCLDEGLMDWHVSEYGSSLNQRDGSRRRCVYTWTLHGDTYKFYTKTLSGGYSPELVWFFGKFGNCHQRGERANSVNYACVFDEFDSSDDTESEELVMNVHNADFEGVYIEAVGWDDIESEELVLNTHSIL